MQQQLDNIFGALTQGTGPQVSPLAFLMLMAVSLLSSLFIAYLYVHFYSNRATGSQVHRAFPLLGISITAIFVTIQFSLPLSLGLLGALSIVRFRTPIKEPEEIGFIMLVIATSIAVATFKLSFVGIIFVVALAALFGQAITRRFMGAEADGTIVISLPANGKPADPAADYCSAAQAPAEEQSSRVFPRPTAKPWCPITSRVFRTAHSPGCRQIWMQPRVRPPTTSSSIDQAPCRWSRDGVSLRGCSSSRPRRFARRR